MSHLPAGREYVDKGASISECGRYRYHLWREWRGVDTPHENWRWLGAKDGNGAELGEPLSCVFVMLNPSTADGNIDDPTVRRCVGFARALKYDRLEIVNLFAYRTKSPRELLALNHDDDPVGARNQDFVRRAAANAGIIICAWGVHGGHIEQNETALGWLDGHKTFALGLTAERHSRHPLYLPSASRPIPYRGTS